MSAARSLLLASLAIMLGSAPAFGDGEGRGPPRTHAETPLEVLTAANGAARHHPTRDGFQEARHVYAYEAGAIYEVYTSPNFVSTILLEPGETLNNIAAGDTSRWMVTQADAETGADGRTIVLVKPQVTGLRTNIVLITDRRTYLVEAVSQAGSAYSAQVAWTYSESDAAPAQMPVEALNFNYAIRTIRGQRPVWLPERVFDDGRRTFIEFAPQVVAAEMPPLFVVTADGAELVNYRVQGRRYVVDRIFDVGELRLGTHAQTIVRLERNPSSSTPPRLRRRNHP